MALVLAEASGPAAFPAAAGADPKFNAASKPKSTAVIVERDSFFDRIADPMASAVIFRLAESMPFGMLETLFFRQPASVSQLIEK